MNKETDTDQNVHLADRQCESSRLIRGNLNDESIMDLLSLLDDWQLIEQSTAIKKKFTFKNFEKTMHFVNQLSLIAQSQDHHPDVNFSYAQCTVTFTTHATDGLTENDFICAAKLDVIYQSTAIVD